MKIRDSGMPEQARWEGFFDPERVLAALGLGAAHADVADFGAGYGSFTLAAARRTRGAVHAIDIDPALLATIRARAAAERLDNVRTQCRDVLAQGSGLPDATVDTVFLFNILHTTQPLRLLAEARRVLRPGGTAAIIHWRSDMATPRGPALAIRPRPAQCRAWLTAAGFRPGPCIDLPPYHFGLAGRRMDPA